MRHVRLTRAGILSASTFAVVSSTGAVAHPATNPSLTTCKALVTSQEYVKGRLTVATDSPGYTP